jgi:starch phosphorylase
MKRSGVEDVPNILDPDVLTIGFARRFAPYKRATLLFSDMKRLFAILSQSEKPVQVVMAGKAHPLNVEGKDLIREVWSHMQGELKGRLVLLENYNIEVGRHLVQGVDVWLNTPTRPVEASGTSGMKAAANGGLNLSVPDGWWLEGFNGVNGWEIGRRDIVDPQQQFIEDAESLYSLLESEVVPMFYDRNSDGLPEKWVEWMRNAIRSAHPRFSASRMVDEYNRRAYLK